MDKHKNSSALNEYIFALLDISPDTVPSSSPLYAQTIQGTLHFLDAMPGGFFIYRADAEEEILYANAAVLRIFGCDTMEEFRKLTGNSFRGLVHPDDLEDVESSIQDQIRTSQYDLDYVEYRIIQKNGEIRWIEDYGHFLHNESVGDLFYVFIADATEKRQQMVQMQTQRLNVIEGLSIHYESIFYIDLNMDKILPYRLSIRVEGMFGKALESHSFHEYIASYIQTWVHPEDQKLVGAALAPDCIRQNLSAQKICYVNYRAIYKEQIQNLQLCLINAGSLETVSQVVLGCRCVDTEVHREMEQRKLLEDALSNAKSAIIAKNAFLSNMSHDMRTPLNALFGYTALAKANSHKPEIVEGFLDKIETAGHLLLELIEKVLDFSWTESNDVHISETDCNLPKILKGIYTPLLTTAAEKNIDFSLDFSGIQHQEVYGDPDKLGLLLHHLAKNALLYTKTGGRVSITAREMEALPNDYAVYEFIIQDTGIGISPEFLEHVFDPFERELNTTFSGIHGTGLGLAIVKNIVAMMGGVIKAESTAGEGSTFTVTLHLRIRNPELSFPEVSREDALAQLVNLKLLLVEDNQINREMESEILEDLGFRIDIAENGALAVEKLRRSSSGEYALVLMDIQMPVMNGWDATLAIRRLENPKLARIPIIALSADAFKSNKQHSIECGMDAHLTKPIDIPVLLNTMAKIIQKHKLLYPEFS